MKLYNRWYSVLADIRGFTVEDALQSFDINTLSLSSEDGHPFVEVGFSDIVQPSKVVEIGRAISRALEAPVFFHGMRSQSITYYVALDKLLHDDSDISLTYLNECGTPIEDIAKAWSK